MFCDAYQARSIVRNDCNGVSITMPRGVSGWGGTVFYFDEKGSLVGLYAPSDVVVNGCPTSTFGGELCKDVSTPETGACPLSTDSDAG